MRHRVDRSADAHDIVQDAFARLVMARERGDVRRPAAFLRTTALNVIRSRARAASVRRAVHCEGRWEAVECDAPSSDRIVESREQLKVLEAAMAELAPKRRLALLLNRVEGLSQPTVADRLGLSLSMVEKHIHHALEHCRRRVAEANDEA